MDFWDRRGMLAVKLEREGSDAVITDLSRPPRMQIGGRRRPGAGDIVLSLHRTMLLARVVTRETRRAAFRAVTVINSLFTVRGTF